jgi:predicted MFS family arabinose efflux permease
VTNQVNETPVYGDAPTIVSVPLFLIGLACLASSISVRAVDPMLPLIADQFTVTLQHVAWLSTAYGLPFAVIQPILGPIADAFGKSLVIKICLALLTASFAVCALMPSFAGLLVARGVSGAVAGGIFPVAIALIGDRVAYEKRQVAISRIVIIAITGQVVGAALSGVIASYAGWRSVFVVTALFVGCIAVASFQRLHGEGEQRHRFSLAAVAADYGFLLTSRRAIVVYGTVLCEGLLMFGVFPFVAPTLLSRGQGGTLTAGLCIASYALGAVIYGFSAKLAIARLGPWRMMAAGGVLVGICYGIIAAPVPWPPMAVLFAFSGFGFYLLHNTIQTLSTELAPKARGAAVALLAASFYIGQGLGPILSGHIAEAGGYSAMFAVSAVLMAALGIISSILVRRS